MRAVKENSDTIKMLNAIVNRHMKHVVDNETMKRNKHMTNKCATTYIAHPPKSSEKKESPIKFENVDEMYADRRPNIMKRQYLSMVVDSPTPSKTTLMPPKIQIPFAEAFEFDMGRPRNSNLLTLYNSPVVNRYPLKSMFKCDSHHGENWSRVTTSTPHLCSKRKRRIVVEHNFSKDDMRAANELTKSISVVKHVVDNETTKPNKHMTNKCATTYIDHPPKSSEKKESPIKFENVDEMYADKRPNIMKRQRLSMVVDSPTPSKTTLMSPKIQIPFAKAFEVDMVKHVVDNETTKPNKHMTNKCAITYIAHPPKSSEKKELPIKFENVDEMHADRRPNIMKRQCLFMVVDSPTPSKTTLISPKIQIPFAKAFKFDMGRPRNSNLLTLHNSLVVDRYPLKSTFKCDSHHGGNRSRVTNSTPHLCSKRKRRIVAEHNFSKDDMRAANELTKSISVVKHVVDNETTKPNKHMTNKCAITYIAHPPKSCEKKESPIKFENVDEIKRKRRIVAKHNFSKDDMRAANELTKVMLSISVGGLNFSDKEDKKVNVNKNETTKPIKHMTNKCATTYIAHQPKSSKKKESPIKFENVDEIYADRRPNIMKRRCLSMVVDSPTLGKTTLMSPKIQIPFTKAFEFDMGRPRNSNLLTLHNSLVADRYPLKSTFKCDSHHGGNRSRVTTSTPHLCSKWKRRIVAEHNFSKDDMRAANESTKSISVVKHVVDNETTKPNKHMTNKCAITYIAHPPKSSEKKESPIKFENVDEMYVDRRPNIMKRQCLFMVVDSPTPSKTTLISPKIQIPFAKAFEFDMGRPRNSNLLTLHNSLVVDQHPLKSTFKCDSHHGGNRSRVTTSTPHLCSKRKRRIVAEHNFSKDDMRAVNELTKVINFKFY
ncbi:hypothetical protein Cgig2_002954 [Carnegiea gigantea]|uniref:Uncharacterized protein n=1 Tax=Carnegiea gigantea TaxID=171969 RepID=A0A9Q1GIP1_9CARY|nr:hypothetical protein Cgig2_002954 [Carnegiea gigantea]